MLITIRPHGVEEATRALDIKVRGKVTQAIREAIRAGKVEGKSLTDARYVRKISPLGKIATRTSGLRGEIKITGARNLIKHFKLSPATRPPHRPPGGLRVQILRGGGGQLPHAFVNRRGVVFENIGGRSLRHLSTVSLPGAWEVVGSKVEAALLEHIEKNMEAVL